MYNLLMVDDEPSIMRILKRTFPEKKYNTRIAYSGEDALTHIEAGFVPDLIILDVMLPSIDGFEVCRRIRAIDRLKHTKVVFLSAKTSDSDVVKGLDLGSVGYIKKPVHEDILKLQIDFFWNFNQKKILKGSILMFSNY